MSENDKLNEEISESLAREMGVDLGDDAADSDAVAEFFREADASRNQPTEEAQPSEQVAPESEEQPRWVHEPTGKEFDNELDYLRYDSGWNKNVWGNRLSEMEQQLESMRERGGEKEQTGSPKPLTMKEIKEKLFPNQPDEYRDNPVTDLVVEGIDNALGLWGAQQQQTIKGLQETVGRLESQLKESSLRSQYGVDTSVEQKLVEKHPWVKAIADPEQRMAAMKHLASQERAPETASPKLLDKVPQRTAGDHVENSASRSVPNSGSDDFEDKLLGMGDGERLSVFGKLFEESEFGRSLTGVQKF